MTPLYQYPQRWDIFLHFLLKMYSLTGNEVFKSTSMDFIFNLYRFRDIYRLSLKLWLDSCNIHGHLAQSFIQMWIWDPFTGIFPTLWEFHRTLISIPGYRIHFGFYTSYHITWCHVQKFWNDQFIRICYIPIVLQKVLAPNGAIGQMADTALIPQSDRLWWHFGVLGVIVITLDT